MDRKRFLLAAGGLALMAGLFVGGLLVGRNNNGNPINNEGDYPLLSNRVFGGYGDDLNVSFNILRQDLRSYFESEGLMGSLYFEYLPTGTSVRVGGEQREVIASLIKVPAAMELYKADEKGLLDIDSNVTLKEEWLDSSFGSLHEKGAGYELTLRQAAELMLTESDNTALNAIASSTATILDPNDSVFNALDADFTQEADRTVTMNARAYSSILKCLYYACHLNYEDSQEILEHLSNANLNSRIRAGVSDKDITVAHKYGTYRDVSQGDCGIVYLPRRPYVLCLILDAPDSDVTDAHFEEISRRVFEFVSND